MFIADIPPHDLSAEFVVLTERRRVEADKARKLQAGWVWGALSMHCPLYCSGE